MLDLEIRELTNLVPIAESAVNDVFLVGYPKSGITWIQNLVVGVLYGLDSELTPDTVVQDLIPDVHYKRFYKRYRSPMFFKSHHLPRPEYKRVIYLLRDGRDVMVSYLHHLTVLHSQEVDFLGMVESGEGLFPCKWHEHVEAWLSNPYNADTMVVKYEDLIRDASGELQRLCAFIGLERNTSFLQLVAAKCSFERMREKEIRYGWDNRQWPRDKAFVRRGKVHSYEDEMPRDVLGAFMSHASDTLRRCGYLPETHLLSDIGFRPENIDGTEPRSIMANIGIEKQNILIPHSGKMQNQEDKIENKEWLGDLEFREMLEVIRPYTMLNEGRLFSLFSLAKRACAENILGNFVESSVAVAGASALLAYVIKRYSPQPRWVYAFEACTEMRAASARLGCDTQPVEAGGGGVGMYTAMADSLREVCDKLSVSDVIRTVEGNPQATLATMRERLGMIALLHLDSDGAESNETILTHVYDRLSDNSIVQVDGYGAVQDCRRVIQGLEAGRGVTFARNPIDDTATWFRKPDKFPLNPSLPLALAEQFRIDDVMASGVISQMSANERFQLYYALHEGLPHGALPLRFVEIGSYAGASLLLTYRALKRVAAQVQGFAVEPGGHPQFFQTLQLFQGDVAHVRLPSSKGALVLRTFFERDGNYPEVIFVDGDHSYEGMREDIVNYYPLLAPGGLMIFHDYLPPLDDHNREAIYAHHANTEPGIRRACQELMEGVYGCQPIDLPLLCPTDPTQTQAHLPIIPGVFSTIRAYRKPGQTGAQDSRLAVLAQRAQQLAQQALALLNAQQPVEALRLAEQAGSLGAKVPEVHYVRCMCLNAVGRHEEALEAAEAVLALNPDHRQAREQVEYLKPRLSRTIVQVPNRQRSWRATLPLEALKSIQLSTHSYTYRGVPMLKNPFDLALYPLLMWNLKPRTIVEIGSKSGGSALWMADMFDNYGIDGHVYSIDIVKVTSVSHPRVTFIEGNGRELGVRLGPAFLEALPRPFLVIDDADHTYETCKGILEFFHPHLRAGEYIVVEDGIITDLAEDPSFESGPHRALREFLGIHDEYQIDANYCDFFGYNVTWNTNGYLKKIK